MVISKNLLVISSLLIVAFCIYLGVSFYVAYRLVATYHSKIISSPKLIASDYENVTISGFENTPLRGWLFRSESNKLIIFSHGITQNRIDNNYYTVLIAKELVAKGYNVLLYDSRGHGESGGTQVTYGI